MPAFRVNGTTGQAPTTVFMGAIPDNYNMMLPMYFQSGAGHGPRMTAIVAATFLNQWVPWNLSFGGGSNTVTASVGTSTTAPDGTTTASHLTEGSNNGIHAFVAGNPTDGLQVYRLRFAAILKAAERSRAYMAVTDGALSSGVQIVFDLTGVQVGVAAATFGTNGGSWAAEFSQVSSLGSLGGGGWCLCIMDVSVSSDITNQTNVVSCVVEPDSGSGTGSISNSYAGDGTSGIYFWKGNLLPPRAWALQTKVFFDDFNSSSTIDLNNTLAPGFNWYTNGFWAEPGFTSNVMPNIPSSSITVSASKMKLGITGTNGVFYELNSAGYLGASGVGGAGVVGNTWQPPFLMEAKFAFDTGNQLGSPPARFVAWWTQSTNALTNSANPVVTGIEGETDFLEYGGAINNPFFPTSSSFTPDLGNTVTGASVGYPAWNASVNYTSGGADVAFGGVLYGSIANSNIGNEPDISPGQWSSVSPDVTMPAAISPVVDFTAQNIYTFLWINDASKYGDHTDTGCYISFMNGIFCFAMAPSSVINYSVGGFTPWGAYSTARNSLATQFVIKQNYKFPIFIQSSNARTISVDYASVTQ